MEPATQSMGAATQFFPWADDVLQIMQSSGVPAANAGNVQALWEAYTDAILEKHLPIFVQDQKWAPTLESMVADTHLSKMTAAAFLTALRQLSYDRGDMAYLDPAKGQAAAAAAKQQVKDVVKSILEAPAKVFQVATKPALDVARETSSIVTSPLKWAAIGLAGAAVLYVGWQLFPLFSGVKKARKKGKA